MIHRSRWARLVGSLLAGVLCVAFLAPSASAQTSTINEARNQGAGASVTVEGTVTRAHGDFVRFQDGSGSVGASGLVVRQTSGSFYDDVADGTISQGTELKVSGTLSEFNGLLQINGSDLVDYTVQGTGTLPSPQAVTLSTLQSNGEDYESVLVSVTDLSFQFPEWQGGQWTFEGNRSYPVSDGTAELTFRMQGGGETELIGTPVPEGSFTYTGVVGEYQSAYQLIPTERGDLPLRFATAPRFLHVEEGDAAVDVSIRPVALEGDETVSVTAEIGEASTADGADVIEFDGSETFTFSGTDSSPKTLSVGAASDEMDEGVERLEITLSSTDGKIGKPGRFTLWILDNPKAQAPIAEGDSGDVLIEAVQQQYGDPRPMGYGPARDSMYARIYNEAGNVVEGAYSGYQITVDPSQGDPSSIAANKGINTEHTWPQSLGAGEEPARSNLHILLPTRAEVNSARSNLPFGEIVDSEATQWFYQDQSQSSPPGTDRPLWSEVLSNQTFEPRHSVKGDVARAVFYFVTVYPNRANFSFFDEQHETLLNWHEQDPVDATEMRRNVMQASYQGNAVNPFVTDSTLADRAYGSGGGTPGGDVIPIAEARDQGIGAAVTVEGTVTRAYGDFVRLQDESGPTGASGLVVRQPSGDFHDDIADGTIAEGTQLEVSGTLSAFNGLFQINEDDLNSYAVQGQGSVPAPQSVSLSDLQAPDGETYESELVRISGLSFPNESGSFSGGTTYIVEDADGTTFEFRVQGSDESQLAGESIPTGSFTYEGVVGQYNGAGFDADEPDEGYQLIPVRPETALPVELAALNASRRGTSVRLTWQTASETNNAGFQVQRKSERTGAEWTQIGFREGGGTTEGTQSYRFTDANPPFEADVLTYRLKQVDLDGSASYSKTVTVQRPVEEVVLQAPFPNPAQGQATVPFAVPERQDVTLRLYDVLGRRVRTLVNGTYEGRQEAQVDLSGLSSGVYFLRLRADGGRQTQRVTVVQ